jgi:hypothetical protein
MTRCGQMTGWCEDAVAGRRNTRRNLSVLMALSASIHIQTCCNIRHLVLRAVTIGGPHGVACRASVRMPLAVVLALGSLAVTRFRPRPRL